jgi:hypothetical protein
MELTYHNPTSICLESQARLNLLTWKLYHRLLTYDRIYAEIFRTASTRKMNIHIILHLKTDSLVKSLRYIGSNCLKREIVVSKDSADFPRFDEIRIIFLAQ